jgi:hypothetical protein
MDGKSYHREVSYYTAHRADRRARAHRLRLEQSIQHVSSAAAVSAKVGERARITNSSAISSA